MLKSIKLNTLLFLSLAVSAYAQCGSLVSPSSLAFGAVPTYGPRPPSKIISITTAGAWSITGSDNSGAVVVLAADGSSTSGTGNATLYAYISGYSDQPGSFGPGTYSIPITVAGTPCTVAVTYNYSARPSNPPFTNNLGVADSAIPNSTSTGGWIQDNDLIPPSAIGSLPGGAFLLPSVGSTITMPVFGSTLRTCTPAGYLVQYSSSSVWNSDHTVLWVSNNFLQLSLLTYPACVLHSISFSPAPAGGVISFDPTVNNIIYYFAGATIRKVVMDLGAFTVTSNTVAYTFSGEPADLSNGGTDGITPDGYISFATHADHAGSTAHPQICLVKLATSVEACRDLALEAPHIVSQGINFTMASRGFSSVTGYRYVYTNPNGQISGQTYGPIYKMKNGDTSLIFDKYIGISPEYDRLPVYPGSSYTDTTCTPAAQAANACLDPTQHSHTVQDIAGHQYLIPIQAGDEPFHPTPAIIDFDAPASTMMKARSLGGGLEWSVPLVDSGVDIGCAGAWCFTAVASNPTTSWKVVTPGCVTNGSNIDCTLESAPGSGLVTGNAAYVGEVGGCTNANGKWAGGNVTVVGAVVTLAGKTCNGAWTSGTGGAYKDVYPATVSHSSEVIAFRVNNGLADRVHRIGTTLSKIFSSVYLADDYYNQMQCNPSNDATLVACNTNGGDIGNHRVVVLATGITPSLTLSGTVTFSGTITIH